jgi:hypothetical protein
VQQRQERAKAEERRRRLDRVAAAARRALDAGDATRARRDLEAALAAEPEARELRDLFTAAEAAERAERERRERLAGRLAEARAAEAAGDLEAAAALARALAREAQAPPAAKTILERVEAALAERRKREEAERRAQSLVGEAAGLAERDGPRAAATFLERAGPLPPQAQQALERYRHEAREREAAERRDAEIERHLLRGKRAFEQGDDTLCEQEMQVVLGLARDHGEAPTYLAWARERREEQRAAQQRRARVQEGLRATRQAFAAGRLAEARSEAERVLSIDPGNLEAAGLHAEAERRRTETGVAGQAPLPGAETLVLPAPAPRAAAAPARSTPSGARRGVPHAVPLLGAAIAVVVLAGVLAFRLLGPRPTAPAPEARVAPRAPEPSALPQPVERTTSEPDARVAAPSTQPQQSQEPAQAGSSGAADGGARARQRARTLLEAGRLDEAAAALGEALRVDPSDAEARALAAAIEQRGRRGAESALAALGEARARAQQAQAAELAAGAFESARQAEQAGTRLLEGRRFAQAAATLAEALEAYRRAEAEARGEAARRAEAERQRAAQAAPDPSPAIDPGALAAQRQFDEARRALDAARRGAPPDARAAAEEARAQEQFRQGRVSEALAALERAGALYEAARSAERERSAVLGTLQRYRAALEGKDIEALRELWPALAGAQERTIRDSFRFTRSMRVELQVQEVKLAGDQATVRCERHDEMVSVDGQTARVDTRPIFVLRRKGDAWSIEAIR